MRARESSSAPDSPAGTAPRGEKIPARAFRRIFCHRSGTMCRLFPAFTWRYALLIAVVASLAPVSGAEIEPLPAQSKAVQNVVLPVPKEIFGTLDHFADSN